MLFCLLALRQAARGRIIKLTETGAAPTKAEAQWFDTLLIVIHKLDGVASLIANPPPAKYQAGLGYRSVV